MCRSRRFRHGAQDAPRRDPASSQRMPRFHRLRDVRNGDHASYGPPGARNHCQHVLKGSISCLYVRSLFVTCYGRCYLQQERRESVPAFPMGYVHQSSLLGLTAHGRLVTIELRDPIVPIHGTSKVKADAGVPTPVLAAFSRLAGAGSLIWSPCPLRPPIRTSGNRQVWSPTSKCRVRLGIAYHNKIVMQINMSD
jgi:hypothetical protein